MAQKDGLRVLSTHTRGAFYSYSQLLTRPTFAATYARTRSQLQHSSINFNVPRHVCTLSAQLQVPPQKSSTRTPTPPPTQHTTSVNHGDEACSARLYYVLAPNHTAIRKKSTAHPVICSEPSGIS